MSPMKLNDDDFDRIVKKAIKGIPIQFRQHLDNILISVRKRPSKELLHDMGITGNGTLFGLFEGVALTDRSVTYPPLFPSKILLFQEPLEEFCESMEDLEREIRITIIHEVGHYMGMSEERLEDLGCY